MTRARYVSNPQAIDIPLTVSANLTANAVITVGNSSVNSVITSNTYSVGSNVSLSTSRLFLGNSTVNSVHTASTLDVGANVNLSTVGLNVGNNTVNAYINSTSFAIGNSTVNTAITSTTITSTALLSIGNTNITGTANVSTGINVGANVNLGTTYMDVGNSTVNTTITNITVSTNTVNVASVINVGANVNLSTSQINVGNSIVNTTITNITVSTNTVNAASIINIGANVSANTTALRVGNSTVNTSITSTALTTTSNTVSIGTAAYVVANGNVGIGTNSPSRKLYVQSDDSSTGGNVVAVRNANTAAGAFINFIGGGGNAPSIGAKNNDIVFTADGYSGTEWMRLSSNGNLGIGVTTQNERLRLGSATAGQARMAIEYNGSVISYFGSYSGIVGSGNATDVLIGASNVLAFASGGAGTERARIDSNGNLGIGTTSTTYYRLNVSGIADTTFTNSPANMMLLNNGTIAAGLGCGINFSMNYDNTATTTYAQISAIRENATVSNCQGALVFGTRDSSGGVAIERMRITSTGGIGINKTAPTELLHIAGTSFISGSTQGPRINLQYTGTSGAAESRINFLDFRGFINSSIGNYLTDDGVGTGAAQLAFKTSVGGVLYDRMRIDTNGNVGIGFINSLTHKLSVDGKIYSSEGMPFNSEITGTVTTNGSGDAIIYVPGWSWADYTTYRKIGFVMAAISNVANLDFGTWTGLLYHGASATVINNSTFRGSGSASWTFYFGANGSTGQRYFYMAGAAASTVYTYAIRAFSPSSLYIGSYGGI